MNKLPLYVYAVLSQVLPQVHAHEQLGQIVENRCGIFALCACAESVGRHTIDSELSSLMPNQGANASLFELEVAAQQIGLATIALHWRDQPSSFDISTSPAVIPVVNHAGKQHFLAVLASRGDQLYVMDFPTPAKWYLTSDIRKRWKWNGQALHVAVTQEAVAALRPQQLSWYEKLFFVSLSGLVLVSALPFARRQLAPIVGRSRVGRRGVTLVELLVSLSILSLLLAVALPAVQSVRQKANQLECSHKLKQLGLAIANYDSTHGQLPPMHVSHFEFPAGIFIPQTLSLQARILPELDQSAVFQTIDFNEDGRGAMNQPPMSTHNPSLLSQRVEAFECPSDSVVAGGISYRFPIENRDGVFVPPVRGRRTAEYRDGTSSTVLFAEKLVGDRHLGNYVPWRDTALIPYQSLATLDAMATACERQVTLNSPELSYGGASWLFSSFQHTCYNHALTPNSKIADCQTGQLPSKFEQGAITPRSAHSGGVNVVFVDGSVRFVSETIDGTTWRAIGTADGGEVTDAY